MSDLKYVADHLFVVSDFPLPEKEDALAGVMALFTQPEDCPEIALVDARLYNDTDLFKVILEDRAITIFWIGRNLLFEDGHINESGWKGMDSVSRENIVFYDPEDLEGPYYTLSDFTLPDYVDCWRKVVNGWWAGRYGGRTRQGSRYHD